WSRAGLCSGTRRAQAARRPRRSSLLGREDRELGPDPAQERLALHERHDHPWVELAAGLGDDLAPGVLPGHGPAVGTVARHRVERIGNREDSGSYGNVGAGPSVRVAVAVPALVVRTDDFQPAALEQ